MDPDVMRAKLESLSRCVARIQAKTPASKDDLSRDLDAQDIIALNLERAVQLCVDMGSHVLLDYPVPSPESMAGVFVALGAAGFLDEALARRMAQAVGFRNIAVHEYASMDWGVVYSVITTRLGDFRDFAKALKGIDPGFL
jgi:uncharacterized protein YutE (UPF0331/DUF86 family)